MLKIRRFLALSALIGVTACGDIVIDNQSGSPSNVCGVLVGIPCTGNNNQAQSQYASVTQNRRQGPEWAFGLQLMAGYSRSPAKNTGGCRLRLHPDGVLESYSHFVWNGYTNPNVMKARMKPTELGFTVPFDARGGAQITLNQGEWKSLYERDYIWASFWKPVPLSDQLIYHSRQRLWLTEPRSNGNLLASRVMVPEDCGPAPL